MASSEAPPVARLSAADLDDCLTLSIAAGWNQTAADWRNIHDRGLLWGIREAGQLLATAALLPFPPATAWVAMVLTAPEARGRGFATRLTQAAVAESEARGLVPQLDATPAGEPVYRRLGFTDGPRLMRWRRPSSGTACAAVAELPPPGDSDRAAMHRLDRAALGFTRADLLDWVFARGPSTLTEASFLLSRPGRLAYQLGPLVAPDLASAAQVLDRVLGALPQSEALFIDCLDEEGHELPALLAERGFEAVRPFLRMARGPVPPLDPTRYRASAGPEFG